MPRDTIAAGLRVLRGAVNTGVLIDGDRALLIDCCDTVTPERLRTECDGVRVDAILCTQHRRPNTAGIARFAEIGADIMVSGGEAHLFTGVSDYWNDPANRWHTYHNQPGQQVLAEPVPVTRTVGGGDTISWGGHTIAVYDTPGATDGAVSYGLEIDERRIAFSGDAISGHGQIWELHALQKGNERIRDYHGYVGNLHKLIPSLDRLREFDLLIPSHGDPILHPPAAIDELIARLERLWTNYVSTSCLNHYFPGMLQDYTPPRLRVPESAIRAATVEPPAHVLRPGYTSWMLRSDSGAALLMDCGDGGVVDTVADWLSDGTISSLDGVWITHYHDDHVDALPALVKRFGTPVATVDPLRDVIEHPAAWFLPCVSPASVPVTQLRKHGESWKWHEFTLTAYHFPGQTYYHSGLLAEGHGVKVFFAGDSGSPTGLDDHCAGNRNWNRAHTGFRRCLQIWRETEPDFIFNAHQPLAFRFTSEELDLMERTTAERHAIIGELTPWPDADFAVDEHWARVYPYEQDVPAGGEAVFGVQFTNHADRPIEAMVEVAAPEGWTVHTGQARATVPALTNGSTGPEAAILDGAVSLHVGVPVDAEPGRYIVPVRLTWDGRYLGQYRHGIVNVT
jgi:glyoxylase-like metal-dependent hydrolase (beta-lactamase superfamily II)